MEALKTKLSVNINKVALIRNGRGGLRPDLVKFATACEKYGADGITVHPRPDERHIRYSDIPKLKEVLSTEFNIEGFPNPRFLKMVMEYKPTQVTLVPDPPGVLTSNTGWDMIRNQKFLERIVKDFKYKGIRVSLFLNPDRKMLEGVIKTQADRIELYTGTYANEFVSDKEAAIDPYKTTAMAAKEMGVGVNAGHDLDLYNLNYFLKNIPFTSEVSIGHALVSDCLYLGLEQTIARYKELL